MYTPLRFSKLNYIRLILRAFVFCVRCGTFAFDACYSTHSMKQGKFVLLKSQHWADVGGWILVVVILVVGDATIGWINNVVAATAANAGAIG